MKRFLISKPYGEWRLPIMVITMSSMVFILITAMFGVTINSQTGELTLEMDWSEWIDEETGLYDPWVYDPYSVWVQNNRLLVFVVTMGMYYVCIGFFIYCWFGYNKWKWQNIPVKERYVEKYYKVKIPNNMLYHIEMLKRRK